ncbi:MULTISPECIES: hypothetical protein [Bacillaceae]|nr:MULTISPECIES: hypothetical protein [Bacillaceae]
MFIFISGLVIGSTAMVFIMSLMMAAKKGDKQTEAFYQEKAF